MFVSLFYVSSLTGLPCTREKISALLTLPPGVEYNAELKSSYPVFMRSTYDKTRDLLTYVFMFKNVVENKRSFEECLKFFASLSIDRLDADFVVFLGRSHGPSWYGADVKSPDFRAFWSVCVTSRDLFVGCSLNTLNSRCGMELYAPNQFCRQLGYCQDIPFLPLFSFNHSYPLRFMIWDSKILITKLTDITNTL
ncbi:hypothetical protein SLEP1_g29689 [Rubroshorea leprosula]|uniref:Uncharacterized protein n=1 Tax=Rubroshorea leprosula TaxID=152421 RepID=A0AAV5K6V4_9ROSI|nr:hypothetical protein SLEP1_g29689 [Rubroshorea leprosula]